MLSLPEALWRYFFFCPLGVLLSHKEKRKTKWPVTPWERPVTEVYLWNGDTKSWRQVCLSVEDLRLLLTPSFSVASHSNSTGRWLGEHWEFTTKRLCCLLLWQLEEIYFQPHKSNRQWSRANISSLVKRTQWDRCCLFVQPILHTSSRRDSLL